MDSINGPQAIIIRDTIRMTKGISMVKCIGVMVVFIKESGVMVSNMAMER